MQPLDQRQGFEIERTDVVEASWRSAGSIVFATVFMMTPLFDVMFLYR